MEYKSPSRFTLEKQSSLKPNAENSTGGDNEQHVQHFEIGTGVRLQYLANEGDLEGIKELLDSGTDINIRDVDQRTALHVAACQGNTHVVQLLLQRGAEVDPKDCWGSSPLADAIYYKQREVIALLEKYGAKPPIHNAPEVPEYEIGSRELDLTNSVYITKGTFRIASWRGIQVAVKILGADVIMDEDKVQAFKDELALLQKLRHPNVVQFLGAVTQSNPMMIVTEYLPKGDLCAFLKRKGALKPLGAIKFALDIARGMNYLHEHRPEAVIHRDLEPSNILRDDSGHLKVADFGLSRLLRVSTKVREEKRAMGQETSWRYMAPEVFRNEEYDTKVDVFSFALILQEMIEGVPPFSLMQDEDVPKSYCQNERPPFEAPEKNYAYGLKQLIEQCWNEQPCRRPSFREIIERLLTIGKQLEQKRICEEGPCNCFKMFTCCWKGSDFSQSSPSPSSTPVVR